MNAILIYLLESALCISLLYTVYWLFLRRDTFFMMNRMYLLGTVGFSILLPLIPVQWHPSGAAASIVYMLEPVLITPGKIEQAAGSHIQWFDIAVIVYFTGMIIFLLRFIVQILQLFFIVRRNGTERRHGMRIVFVDRGFSPFSFFNMVFINTKNVPADKLDAILTHEGVHVRQRHTLDLILAEILIIIQWFNPFAWFIGREFKTVHEFLADEGVLKAGISRSEYQQLILDETMGIQVNGLTNNFNVSLIKKRILMISKVKSGKFSVGKVLLAFPAVLLLALLFSATSYGKVFGPQDNKTKTVPPAPPAPPPPPSAPSGKIYDKVDVEPVYPGGFEALGDFILKNLKYPEAAIKNKTQGKVLLSFVVWSDGSVGNVKVKQGIGSGCDEEAIRVVRLMPNWKPGQQDGKNVNVSFFLPINFALNKDKKDQPKK